MRHLSDADFTLILRLLRHLSRNRGESVKDKEMSRKAGLMVRKMEKNECHGRLDKDLPEDN